MPDRRARIAVLGAGWWAAQVYIPSLLANPDADLVAINNRDPEALARVAAAFPGPRGYLDHAELLAAERPDGVVVASPHVAHYAQAAAALAAGAHVLVDKPMTTSAADARALVALAAARGREIVVPYGWNFQDFTRRAAALMAAGAIGDLRHGVVQMASPTADLFGGEGLRETETHLLRPQSSTWADPARAGGYGWGQLSHALGLLFRLVDAAPLEVYALAGRSPTGVDFYDAAVLTLAGGATVTLSGAATVPKRAGYQLDIRLFGTDGMLLVDVERPRLELRRHDGADETIALAADAGAYTCLEPPARLVDICLGRALRNEAPGIVGQRAVEVLDAMYRSIASGRPEPA